MKLKALHEARIFNQRLSCWELLFCGGGRGGAEDAEFGFNEHINVSELPDNLHYNLIYNNTHSVYLPTETDGLIEEADEMLKYAKEDISRGADIRDPEKIHDQFVRAVRSARGMGFSLFVDDWEHLFITNIKTPAETLALVQARLKRDNPNPDPNDKWADDDSYARKALGL